MKRKIMEVLSLLLVLLSVSGCGNTSGSNLPEGTENSIASTEITENTQASVQVKDFDGYEFRVLAIDDEGSWKVVDVFSEGENGDTINDAVYKRNSIVQENYNINISQLGMPVHEMPSLVMADVMAGDDNYDVIQMSFDKQMKIAIEDILFNLNTLESLDFSNSWWDTSSMKNISIDGKIFMCNGDINIADNNATWCILFNKELKNKFTDIPDLYQTVKNGKWTIDIMYTYAKNAALDLNSDGKMDYRTDQFGIALQNSCANALLICSGQSPIIKDANGSLLYSLNNENIVNVFEKIHGYLTDDKIQINWNKTGASYNDAVLNPFKSSRCLFYMTPINTSFSLRDMDADYGILPVPKYDKNQENYISIFQYSNGSSYSIPVSVSDPERSALILEALGYESEKYLTPAYYDIALQRKNSRDDESSAMLDLIFNSGTFDISESLRLLVGVSDFLPEQCQNSTFTYSSSEVSKRDSFIKEINKVDEAIKNTNKDNVHKN